MCIPAVRMPICETADAEKSLTSKTIEKLSKGTEEIKAIVEAR
jgi:hypothetical protein